MSVVMADPATWPLRTVLPLVKPDGTLLPPLGLLLAGRGPTVFECNLSEATPDRLRHCPRLVFTSFEDVEAAGWRCD